MKLGFLKRICIDFYDSSALKTLYFSLVKSQIEYDTLIWHTDSIVQNTSLFSIQNIFLRYLSYKCNVERTPHSGYNIISNFFRIDSIKNRYLTSNLRFLFKILHNMMIVQNFLKN